MCSQTSVVYGVQLEGGLCDLSIKLGSYGVSITGRCYD